MRRVPATLLLALFSFALTSPLVVTNAEAKLPACCRRAGKHHCTEARTPDGPAFQARCLFYPGTQATPAISKSVAARTGVASVSLVRRPTGPARTAPPSRDRINGTRSQRGPPSLLI